MTTYHLWRKSLWLFTRYTTLDMLIPPWGFFANIWHALRVFLIPQAALAVLKNLSKLPGIRLTNGPVGLVSYFPRRHHFLSTLHFSSYSLQLKYSARSAYYSGMTFSNRERIALLESKFHFQFEYCNVPTIALFQIRDADWFIRRMSTCK